MSGGISLYTCVKCNLVTLDAPRDFRRHTSVGADWQIIYITYDKFRCEIISVKRCPTENLLHRNIFQWPDFNMDIRWIVEISPKFIPPKLMVNNVTREGPLPGPAQGEHHHQYLKTKTERQFDKCAVASILLKFLYLYLYKSLVCIALLHLWIAPFLGSPSVLLHRW